jgi:pyruvate/2-oxoglutarate dehydrogenase complex dihydrolipoamide dehydrogenase (E3) component
MAETLTPDICIIGAAAASLAAAAAAFGAATVVVEKDWAAGGPGRARLVSQALAAAAGQAQALRSSAAFGISAGEPGVDFKAVMRHVRAAVAATAPNAGAERLTALGVKVIKAEARFKDRRTLIAGETQIRARRFVLAPGSTPLLPPLPGLVGIDHLTEDTLSSLSRLPGHLIVVGGGPRAIELAQSFRRLGSAVTVVTEMEALAGFDPEMAAVVLRRLRSEGATVLEHMEAVGVERRGKAGVRLSVQAVGMSRAIDGTHLLVVAGRVANIQGLDLGKAGIANGDSGVPVNDALRTGNRRVYALGEAAAGAAHSPELAEHQAGLLVRTLLFRQTAKRRQAVVPVAVLTDPELAHAGLAEAEAARTQKAIRILRWPYAENDRAQAERRTEGHIKLIAGAKGEILGVTIAGANAAELIGVWTLALSKGLTLADMAAEIVPYPTMGEIGKRSAIAYFAASARKPLLRRLVRALRIFG